MIISVSDPDPTGSDWIQINFPHPVPILKLESEPGSDPCFLENSRQKFYFMILFRFRIALAKSRKRMRMILIRTHTSDEHRYYIKHLIRFALLHRYK